ncbi:MAG: Pyridine nucleotide-disulfide oxidoreductase, FAD/NAD(P)-binding domain-containing protein [Berkelbacteria bacterium GW2011_GWB1_38_5]|uniref:Pyridine nucleotide-disulfide oxidoreductase, FAD/NAD(P)-binding domain-containing protein n=1 Tax=Berkelbacteria bacterium GW2011_GWB1_38_5 TaxID=1618336 RepID=A0A0G0K0S9_9BACT|nr:MAG: Pyridine nucleotide-disulfide oxidoreductase, FAD/NAD(P)-binding domain-containing protein [Berkelbacteria bacterium GW2011_GWB1_38_5]
MYDVIIIGGGPAGLTAAIYLARKKINTVILTQTIGGQIMDGPLIENYPGFEQITGPDWVEKVKSQVEKLKVEVKSGSVEKIIKENGVFSVEGSGYEKLQAKAILICSGKSPRKLNIPGEDKFQGKGISSCVTCDGPLFQEKIVAVIGGGNSAISAALELSKYAQKVYILNLGSELIGEQVRIDELKKNPKVEIIGQAKTMEIKGTNLVESLKYKDLKSQEEKEIACEGIFSEIGWEPSTGYLQNFVTLTSKKEIKIDENNATDIEGVFAAGDATEIVKKQLVIAAGEGAKAALNVWDYLTLKAKQ